MKKFLNACLVSILMSCLIMMSSCYTHRFIIGSGPQSGVQASAKNNFFLFGLIPGKVSDPQQLAGGAKDFEITEVMTFVDGLLAGITFGIYTPTTTRVQK